MGRSKKKPFPPQKTPPVVESESRPAVGWWIVGALALIVGTVLRFAAARGDLWYDEIIVFQYTRLMRFALDAIVRIHVDNNHALNTIWAYLLGEHRSEVLYRLPAIGAGIATIPLAGSLTVAQRPAARVGDAASRARAFGIGAVLFASSYLMVHYASEARGYAPAIAFGMVGVLAGLRAEEWRVGGWTAAYVLALALAVLAHPLAMHVLVGCATWQVVELLAKKHDAGVVVSRWMAWQLPPLAFLALLYWIHFGRMQVLGGPRLDPITVLGNASGETFGVPGPAVVGLAALAVVACVGVVTIVRRPASSGSGGRSLWAFYAAAGFLSPALLGAISPDPFTFERYFAPSLAMLLLLLAAALTRVVESRRGDLVVGLCLALFVMGNLPPTARLLASGRGDYRGALRVIAQESREAVIPVGSESDARVGPLVEYYGPEVAGPGRRIVYQYQNDPNALPPAWFILGWQHGESPSPERFEIGGPSLVLRGRFLYAQLSGFNWDVYRVDDRPSNPVSASP